MLAAGLDRGLRMQDADVMTIGMWIDFVIEWNNSRSKNRTETGKKGKPITRRKATQVDFDSF